jgi:hypothetical protein
MTPEECAEIVLRWQAIAKAATAVLLALLVLYCAIANGYRAGLAECAHVDAGAR